MKEYILTKQVNEYMNAKKEFTIRVDNKQNIISPKSGYIISITPFIKKEYMNLNLIKYVVENETIIINSNKYELFIGGWLRNDILKIDISINEEDITKAIELGNYLNQKAIYDLNTCKDIGLKY